MKISNEQKIKCPICNKDVLYSRINSHIDTCTIKEKPKSNNNKGMNIKTLLKGKRPINEVWKESQQRKSRSNEVIDLSQDNEYVKPDLKKPRTKDVDLSNIRYLQRIQHLPLSEKLRPKTLLEYVGQQHLLNPERGTLYKYIEQGTIPSMILWGPPGVGKTSLSRIMIQSVKEKYHMIETSATRANTQELRSIFDKSKQEYQLTKRRIVLFIDEIHRFNKVQQDLLLPYVENGDIVLIGATTENPSFQLNNALISRCHIFVLNKLNNVELTIIVNRAIGILNRLRKFVWKVDVPLRLSSDATKYLVSVAMGDSRRTLNLLEMVEVYTRGEEQKKQANQKEEKAGKTRQMEEEKDEVEKKEIDNKEIKEEEGEGEIKKEEEEIKEEAEAIKEDRDEIKDEKDETKKEEEEEKEEENIVITLDKLKDIIKHNKDGITTYYDTKGDYHYDTISALHKSVRGNDPNASLYYLARMLKNGEDPLYIARRMIRMASEDIGIANNSMLSLAVATHDTVMKIGLPEADVALAHCCVALAQSPKSIDVYRAWNGVNTMLNNNEFNMAQAEIPMHIRNAPTKLMQDLGYHEGYKYNPEYVDGQCKQEYFPKEVLERCSADRRELKFLWGQPFGNKFEKDTNVQEYERKFERKIERENENDNDDDDDNDNHDEFTE